MSIQGSQEHSPTSSSVYLVSGAFVQLASVFKSMKHRETEVPYMKALSIWKDHFDAKNEISDVQRVEGVQLLFHLMNHFKEIASVAPAMDSCRLVAEVLTELVRVDPKYRKQLDVAITEGVEMCQSAGLDSAEFERFLVVSNGGWLLFPHKIIWTVCEACGVCFLRGWVNLFQGTRTMKLRCLLAALLIYPLNNEST